MQTPPVPKLTGFNYSTDHKELTVTFSCAEIAHALGFVEALSQVNIQVQTQASSAPPQPSSSAPRPVAVPPPAPTSAAPPVTPVGGATVHVTSEAQQAAAAQAAPPVLEEIRTEQTEVGPVRVLRSQGVYTAEFKCELGEFSVSSGNADSALGELLERVRKARRAAAPQHPPAAQVAPAPAPVPPPVAGPVPPELASAVSYTEVIRWMIGNGFTTPEAIVAKCEELRPGIPVLSRLTGDLLDRTRRALTVVQQQLAHTG